MITYLDKILMLYPGIQHVMYWHAQYDGTPWNDPYDGLIWENKTISKPSKEMLDSILEKDVLHFFEIERKKNRDNEKLKDLMMIGLYNAKKTIDPNLTFSAFLDDLELKQNELNIMNRKI